MRVLVVTAPFPWDVINGASLVLYHHLRILAKRHEISVLGAGANVRERTIIGNDEGLPLGVTMRWFGTRIPLPIDYAIRRFRSSLSGEPAHVHWVERRGLVRAFEQELARKPDVVHLHGWGTAQLSRLANEVPCVHVPIDAWSLGTANRALPRVRLALERSQARRILQHERRHYGRCAAVVVVAQGDMQQVRRLAPTARVEVIPNGVDPGPEPGPLTTEPVIGFHGSFQNQANRDAAVFLAREVFPIVLRARPDARLRLIGRWPPSKILSLSNERIHVTGMVPDIRSELEDVGIYVAPMVSGTGIKNKVLEAMAAGRPIVATKRAVDGIDAASEVLVADTAAAIARHVIELLASDERRRAIGAAARARVVSTFSWQRSAEAIEALWMEFAGSGFRS